MSPAIWECGVDVITAVSDLCITQSKVTMNILRLGREPPSLYHWTVVLLVLAAALSALGFSAQATSAFGLDGE